MNDTEGLLPDSLVMFGITINGILVPYFDQSDDRRWYQLAALFRALELQESGVGSLSSKPGNLFPESGEFQKINEIWYGTAEGLSLYADYLYRSQFNLTYGPSRETAQIRSQVITQWLSSLDDDGDAPGTADGNGTVEQAPENGMEYKSNADAVTPSTETNNEQIPTNDEKPEPMNMPAAKPAGIDMGLFERLYDNLLGRVPYMASCLSIPSDVSMAWKLFAVMAAGYLRGSEPIMRPQNDSDGIWGQEQYLCVSEAIRRSLLFGQ